MTDLLPVIHAEQAALWLFEGDAVVWDLRDAASFQHQHIAGARHVSQAQLADSAALAALCADLPAHLILVCADGETARQAGYRLQRVWQDEPLARPSLLDGGLAAWQKAGLPVVYQPLRHMSLHRQFLVIMGLGLLATLLFSIILSGLWLIPAFGLAAALVYQGLGGSAHVEGWLLRLPWNKNQHSSPALRPADGA